MKKGRSLHTIINIELSITQLQLMTRGPIPDEVPTNLQEQILLEDARSQPGIEIQGGPDIPLRDVPRLVANYGGSAEDWYKISSNQSAVIEGAIAQVHWFKILPLAKMSSTKSNAHIPKLHLKTSEVNQL